MINKLAKLVPLMFFIMMTTYFIIIIHPTIFQSFLIGAAFGVLKSLCEIYEII